MALTPKSRNALIAIGLVVAASVIYVVLRARAAPRPPEPGKASEKPTRELIQFLASDAFPKLPAEQQREIVDNLMRRDPDEMRHEGESLPDDVQIKALSNAIRAPNRLTSTIDEYFTTPAGPKRTAILDRLIDESIKSRKDREKKGPASTRAATRPTGADFVKMMKAMEGIPPERLARMMEFRGAINQRRKERGLPVQSGPMR